MTDIAGLIERLKEAGADRELNARIHAAISWASRPEAKFRFRTGSNGYEVLIGNARAIDEATADYTGSIDGARTLLLPEHSFGGLSQVSRHDWIMMIFSRTDSRARWEGEAATAENAICIAALKARQEVRQTGEQ